ncbi:MAG TPA: tRNA (N(6)-L-threonylcarbamoyladenosine(37)-C(2))-methylthiotransferase MtaB [Pirellulales bacterium]|nr:tRNA (N(6)-L-threonylcarbamoyladenosine(37)-C(2))-methylthiotransferase MtaB [Pirellulales bacterium]
MPLLKTVTLGCKVNQYETQYVREGLERVGFREAAAGETADLCIVNTCTVTAEGDAKSRQTIRQLAARNPGTRIVVMGCYATRAPEDVAQLPGVVEVVTDKRELPDLLGRFGVVDIPTGISRFDGRKRAYVKVQDGCMLNCSFCIIPKVRPQLASRPAEHILDEVRRLLDHGYREIILTGIHLGHYGVDFSRGRAKADWFRLAQLVDRIARLEGDFRVRLSSIEATEVTRELIAAMAEYSRKVCPHLHVSLQSGSDRVLRRMRRRWGARRFVDRCRLVRETLDQPALTTDIIVGFPGEAESDFMDTCRVAEEVGFSKIHIFPFSPRRTTPAAEMPDQVPHPIKAERVERLAELERRLADGYYQSLLGRKLQVMVESPVPERPGYIYGTSCRYAIVEAPAGTAPFGRFAEIVAGGVANGRIQAAEFSRGRETGAKG